LSRRRRHRDRPTRDSQHKDEKKIPKKIAQK
jgi:hypothetical protein